MTIKDVESLFKVAPSTIEEKKEEATSDLMNLPPGVAAGIAAERRLMDQTRLVIDLPMKQMFGQSTQLGYGFDIIVNNNGALKSSILA
ncbi:hypothetical protein Tco_1302607 [Tanacetum coccineum]